MANTKIPVELSSTPGIVDNSNATAITIDSSEDVTLAGNINLVDSKKAIFGAGDDLQIYHDGSNSYINDSGTGNLRIGGTEVDILNPDSNEFKARFKTDGSVELYHNNAKKFETTSTGVDVTGTVIADGGTFDGDVTLTGASADIVFDKSDNALEFATNAKAVFGDSLTISRIGNSSYIHETGSGDLYIKGSDIYITDQDNNQFIHLDDDGTGGTVRLKHEGSTKLATTSTGVDVTGVLAVNSGTTDTAATFTSSDTAVAVNFVASDNSMQIATSSTDGIIKNNGAGSFRFFNNGSEAARINSSGLVGIGLTSPSSPLTIKSSATHSGGGLRIIQDSGTNVVASLFGGVNSGTRFGRLELSETSGDAINVRISADPSLTSYINAGNVGIGDTNPSAIRLSVVTPTANHVGLQVENSNTADSFGMIVKGGNDANDYTADFRKRDNTGIMRIRGDGNIGIGTDSPSALLHLQSTGDTIARVTSADGNTALLDLGDVSDPDGGRIFYDSGSNLGFTTASTERMRIDSSGRVGIGTSSPVKFLDVGVPTNASAIDANIRLNTHYGTQNTARGGIQMFDGSNVTAQIDTRYDGSKVDMHFGSLYNGGYNTTSRMVITGSGNIGIGNSSPTNLLHLYKYQADTDIRLQGSAGSYYITNDYSDDALTFIHNSTERMRIDSSGNLLVGQTSLNYNVVGSSIASSGLIRACVDGGLVLALNRKTSHGQLINFYKDGTTVGSISTNTYSLPSDKNFKRNIKDLNIGLNLITKLKPSQYNYKIDSEDCPKMYGLIAQDLEESLTEVGVEKNSTWLLQHEPNDDEKQSDYSVDYLKLTPVLIKAIQEQQTLIETQQTTINDLKSRIETLEG